MFYEYGIELPRGRHWGLKAMPTAFVRAEGRIEATVMEALRTQLELIQDMSRRIERWSSASKPTNAVMSDAAD